MSANDRIRDLIIQCLHHHNASNFGFKVVVWCTIQM